MLFLLLFRLTYPLARHVSLLFSSPFPSFFHFIMLSNAPIDLARSLTGTERDDRHYRQLQQVDDRYHCAASSSTHPIRCTATVRRNTPVYPAAGRGATGQRGTTDAGQRHGGRLYDQLRFHHQWRNWGQHFQQSQRG